jgi:hypothetical protein
MWKHKTKWLVRGGRKVRCYLCGKKILAKGDLFLFHGDTGYYSHQSCQAESTTISGNERRRAVKKIAVGAAVVGAIAAGAGKLIDISSQSKGLNSPDTQTILTSQGLIPPALTSDPSNPVPGQIWYRSDAGVEAHFDGVQNRVVYSSEINDGNVHVTSKGIVNGLSVLPNDGTGWFGPDTTLGATAPGQYGGTYTETLGIQEAISYSISSKIGIIKLLPGTYDVTNASLHTDPISGQKYQIYIPANADTSPILNLTIISDVITHSAMSGVTSSSVCGAVIESLDAVTAANVITAFIFGAFTSTNSVGGSVMNLYMDGISFQTNATAANNLGAIDVHNTATASFGILDITTNFSGTPTTYNSATGLYWMIGGSQSTQIHADSINIEGYLYGVASDLPHTHIGQLNVSYCKTGLISSSGSHYAGDISYFEMQNTVVGIYLGADVVAWHIGVFNQADEGSSGTFGFGYSYSIQSTASSVVTIDMYDVGTSGLAPTFAIASGAVVSIRSWGLDAAGSAPYFPTVTTPSVPTSGTAQKNTNPYAVDVYIYGGDVTEIQITKNGTAYTVLSVSTAIAMSGQLYRLNPGDSITVTYSTAPSWEWLSD